MEPDIFCKVNMIKQLTQFESTKDKNDWHTINGFDGREYWIEYTAEPFTLHFNYAHRTILYYVKLKRNFYSPLEGLYEKGMLFQVNDYVLEKGPWVEAVKGLINSINLKYEEVMKGHDPLLLHVINKKTTQAEYLKELQAEWGINE